MADLLLAVATFLTDALGPLAGPLSGGLPVVVLLTAIAVCMGLLPWAARADAAEATGEVADRG